MSHYRPKTCRGQKAVNKRYRLARRDGRRCFYCLRPFTDVQAEGTLDHFVPKSLWRCSALPNLVLACKPCNERKANSLPLTFAWLLLAAYRPNDYVRAA